MSNFLFQLCAADVDVTPSSLLTKGSQSGSFMMGSSSAAPVPPPQNLIAVDPRTSLLYVASYPTCQEADANTPGASNVARVYAYPYAGVYAERRHRRPVEIVTARPTDKKKRFVPKSLVLSPEGDFLAVVGAKTIEVIKLHSIVRNLSLRGISHRRDTEEEDEDDNDFKRAVIPEDDRADSYGVETMAAESFFIDLGGPSVVHVAWHPLSFAHLVVLTSNNIIATYPMFSRNPGVDKDQEFELQQDGSRATSFAFPCDTAGALAGKGPRTIPEGEQYLGWNVFTCFVLYEDGRTDALCPVIPWDMYISTRIKEEISYWPSASGGSAARYMSFVESTLNKITNSTESDDDFFMFRKDTTTALEVVPVNVLPPFNPERGGAAGAGAVVASKLVYCLGSPSVLVRVASNGVLDVHALCSDMYPHWKPNSALGVPPPIHVAAVVGGVALGTRASSVCVDPSTSCVVCRANGARIYVTAKCGRGGCGHDALFDVDLGGLLGCLRDKFESGDSKEAIRKGDLDVRVRTLLVPDGSRRIFGVGFHSSTAMLVLDGDGRLKVITNEKVDICEKGCLGEKSGVEGPLKIELNGTTDSVYAMWSERLFGKEYLNKVIEIKELIIESQKR